MRGDAIVALFLLLGTIAGAVVGFVVEGAPAPLSCLLLFYGGCFGLLLLVFMLVYLHALALALVYPVPDALERPLRRALGSLVCLGLSAAMGVGLLCKYFGAEGALDFWLRVVLALCAFLLGLFLIMYVVEFVLQRYRRRQP